MISMKGILNKFVKEKDFQNNEKVNSSSKMFGLGWRAKLLLSVLYLSTVL